MKDDGKNIASRVPDIIIKVLTPVMLVLIPPGLAFALLDRTKEGVSGDWLLYELLPAWVMPVYAFFCFCICFCAILKTVATFDWELEKKFLELPMSVGLRDELSLIFRNLPFWLMLAATEALYIIDSPTFVPEAGGAMTFAMPILSAAAVFILFVASYLAACSAWNRDRIRMRGGAERRRGFVGKLLMSLLPTVIGSALLVGLFPYFVSLRFVFSAVFGWIVLIVPAAVAAIYIYRYAKALLSRRKFLRELRGTCREFGFELSEIKKPFLSAVRMTAGESFRVTARGRTYVCKLIGVPKKGDPLTVYDDGTCIITHSVRFRRKPVFHFTKSYDLSIDAAEGERKIFIFNPVPALLLARRGGYEAPIDVGESVGAYKIYTGTSFINALRRDTLDR